MKNTLNFIVMVILWVVFWQLAKHYNIPWWGTTILVVGFITVSIVISVANTVKYNFRPDMELESIPQTGYQDRRESMQPDTNHLEREGFNKIDEFFVRMNPESVVYAYKHATDPIFLYLYHLGTKKSYDLITVFTNDNALTTSASPDAGMLPYEPGSLMQVVVDPSLANLIHEHKKAVTFLQGRGLNPTTPSVSFLRQKFIGHIHRFGQRVKKIPFWPIMLVIWTFTKPGLKVHGMPIEQQVQRGLIDPLVVPRRLN